VTQFRPARVSSPLGPEVLRLVGMTGEESLGRAYQYQLELHGDDDAVSANALLGKPLTVHVDLDDNQVRHFGGLCSRFVRAGGAGRNTLFRATVRPWLWFLSHSVDCRIFQHLSVPDIIKQVFRERGFTDFDDALAGSYREREYIVQYRESDFQFVTRLMEQEGIYFFVRHQEATHRLVLADGFGAHAPVPGYETIPYFPPDHRARRARDYVDHVGTQSEVRAGTVTLEAFDFERPRADLLTRQAAPREHEHGGFEVFDYPGDYLRNADGEAAARTRLEALHAEAQEIEGEGNARGIGVGGLFTLAGHPRQDHNRQYLVTRARYTLRNPGYESGAHAGAGDGGFIYRCVFSAIGSQVPFRTPRTTAKPCVGGPQTAVVVGPKGEEIWTDRYGRVKVQFHWDRQGKADEHSSCWVRVAQVWAGARYGAMHIPRVGQEVIVDFLEGDPDQPLITGRVYNADNMPPWELPGNATQSGIMSRSTKGGSVDNHNQLRFEDRKGGEEVFLQAEKDHTERVKNDQQITVGRNRRRTVARNEVVAIGGTRDKSILLTETITVGGARAAAIGASERLTVAAQRSTDVGQDDALVVGGNRSADVRGNQTISVGKSRAVGVKGNRSAAVDGHDSVRVGKSLTVEVADQITFKTGEASLTMKKDGTIVLKGKNLSLLGKDMVVKGSGSINIKATADVVVKGRTVKNN
jgi:type VI secretion system secreted protein VgrG